MCLALGNVFSTNHLQVEASKASIQTVFLWNIGTSSASDLSSRGRMIEVFVERKFESRVEHG